MKGRHAARKETVVRSGNGMAATERGRASSRGATIRSLLSRGFTSSRTRLCGIDPPAGHENQSTDLRSTHRVETTTTTGVNPRNRVSRDPGRPTTGRPGSVNPGTTPPRPALHHRRDEDMRYRAPSSVRRPKGRRPFSRARRRVMIAKVKTITPDVVQRWIAAADRNEVRTDTSAAAAERREPDRRRSEPSGAGPRDDRFALITESPIPEPEEISETGDGEQRHSAGHRQRPATIQTKCGAKAQADDRVAELRSAGRSVAAAAADGSR